MLSPLYIFLNIYIPHCQEEKPTLASLSYRFTHLLELPVAWLWAIKSPLHFLVKPHLFVKSASMLLPSHPHQSTPICPTQARWSPRGLPWLHQHRFPLQLLTAFGSWSSYIDLECLMSVFFHLAYKHWVQELCLRFLSTSGTPL